MGILELISVLPLGAAVTSENWSTDFPAALRSSCGLAAGLVVVPRSVCHPKPIPSCHCTHSALRIPQVHPESPRSALPCWGLFPAGKFCRNPEFKVLFAALAGDPPWHWFSAFPAGNGRRRLGRGRCSARGRSFGGSFPLGAF